MSNEEFQEEGDVIENEDNAGESDNKENLVDNNEEEDQEDELIGKSALTYCFVIIFFYLIEVSTRPYQTASKRRQKIIDARNDLKLRLEKAANEYHAGKFPKGIRYI